ncbi:MAG: protein TolQ [Succinivibrio sp.]|nr:protein TolQ [Succinivibrio sp.]
MASGQLSFSELIFNASFLVQLVMLFLLVLSIFSWTIIISRSNQYKIARRKADEFEDKFWSGIDLNNLYQECIKRQQSLVGLEVIYTSGFKEFVRLINSGPADQEVVMDGTYRQMKVAQSREVENLETHLASLATIGSISPYIGLFGTVWGIMHAFVALAAVKNATLSMVAPPIAEALIATAMGLFAAIPAVMFYNRFVTKVDALENRYLNFMDEFATILNRRLVTVRSQLSHKERPESMERDNAAAQNNQQNSVTAQNGLQNGQQPAAKPMTPPNGQAQYAQNLAENGRRELYAQTTRPVTPPRQEQAQEDDGPHYITPGVAGDYRRLRRNPYRN